MTTTTMSELSVDLHSEIICRVPLKSMKKVRLTCKTWDTLSKSCIFRKMHMRNDAAREPGESRMVAIMDSTLHLISVVVNDVDHPNTEIRGKLTCFDKRVKIIKVFHCDGLLLCVLEKKIQLVVWNPYLGQRWWIEPPSYSHRYDYGYDTYIYALGYDNNKKSHKILRFIDGLSSYDHVCYEIYDFDSNLWRTLDVGTPHWFIEYRKADVPLNGNTYWLANHRNSEYYGSDSLICFDFTSETFGPILPLPYPAGENRSVSRLLSSLKGDKLSLLLDSTDFTQPFSIEIWVTTMISPNDVSWSMFFKVDTGPALKICFSHSGFFIDEEKNVAMVFDRSTDTSHTLYIIGEDGFFRQVNVDPLIERGSSGFTDHAHVCDYVPSLVQLQIKNQVEKRKQPMKLKRRRCQRKKSRLDQAKRTRRT